MPSPKLGEIVNVMADEKVLDENGKIDGGKLDTFLFDQMRCDYYAKRIESFFGEKDSSLRSE